MGRLKGADIDNVEIGPTPLEGLTWFFKVDTRIRLGN